MTVTVTREKGLKIINLCNKLRSRDVCTIRQLAEVIGVLVASEPAVDFAPLYYKGMEHYKNIMLQCHKGDYEVTVSLPNKVKCDLLWWVDNILHVNRSLLREKPSVTLTSDSSDFAWGGVREEQSAGGPWAQHEKDWHINVKELFAVLLTLQTFCDKERGIHIRLLIDNTTSVAYINGQGGRKPTLHKVAKRIWLWAIQRQIWLSALHLPGIENVQADKASREEYKVEGEWKLEQRVFDQINDTFGPFEVDLMATRLNFQCKAYFSWMHDPGSIGTDAFMQEWGFNKIYVFPPFSIVGRVLQKLERDQADACVLLPLWPSQFWFGKALRLLTDYPRILPNNFKLLHLPQDPLREHVLESKLKLTLFPLSGKRCKNQAFRLKLPRLLDMPGEAPQKSNIGRISRDGCFFVVERRLLQCKFL